MKLYHATTPRKAKKYRETGCICKPVRGFTTLQGAMAWAIKVGRTVIYEVEGNPAYKLPDHHTNLAKRGGLRKTFLAKICDAFFLRNLTHKKNRVLQMTRNRLIKGEMA